MTIGSRAKVYSGSADKTAGGLMMKDLIKSPDGRIKSVAASVAAKKRVKEEGPDAMTKMFKTQKGKFSLQPKKGTKLYKKIVKL